jgi:hypothetical protein
LTGFDEGPQLAWAFGIIVIARASAPITDANLQHFVFICFLVGRGSPDCPKRLLMCFFMTSSVWSRRFLPDSRALFVVHSQ